MKKNQLLKSCKVFAFIAISYFLSNHAMAQTYVTITVNPKPSGTIVGAADVCPTKMYSYSINNLTDNVTPTPSDGSNITVEWKYVGTNSNASAIISDATSKTPNITFTNSGTTTETDTLWLVMTNPGTSCKDSAFLAITVQGNVLAQIWGENGSSTNADSVACSGITKTFKVETVAGTVNVDSIRVDVGSTGVTYVLDETSKTAPKILFTNTTNANQYIWVKAYYSSGVGCNYVDSLQVLVVPEPKAEIVAKDSSNTNIIDLSTKTLCPDNTHAVVAKFSLDTAGTATPISNVTWTIIDTVGKSVYASITSAGALSIDSNATNSNQTFKVVATYQVAAGGNCAGALYYDTVTVTVHPTPKAIMTADNSVICNDNSIQLTVTPINGLYTGAWSFEWDTNPANSSTDTTPKLETPTSGASNLTFNVTLNTTATQVNFGLVKLTDSNGCVSTFTVPAP